MSNISAHRMIARVRQIWAELDYAQRRLLEIRTGLPLLTDKEHRDVRASIEELEALYALEELESVYGTEELEALYVHDERD